MINHQASSLFNVIADGFFKNTTVGKDEWLSLIKGSNLQENCNRQGFNIDTPGYQLGYFKLRLGIITNNQNDCLTCNSCIGFGASVRGCAGQIRKTTCGNIAICGQPNKKKTAAFGFILVQ